jgi:hypothetical protein
MNVRYREKIKEPNHGDGIAPRTDGRRARVINEYFSAIIYIQ